MTIAACHVSPEGVILGTDSTSTVRRITPDGNVQEYHHDYEQKLFAVGPVNGCTVGLATWGIGRIGTLSHRTLAARLAQQHRREPFDDLRQMAQHAGEQAWQTLTEANAPLIQHAFQLLDRVEQANYDYGTLSEEEFQFLLHYNNTFAGGYFLGGRLAEAEDCKAFEVTWSIIERGANVREVLPERPYFRGQPQIMERLILGYDSQLVTRILNSGQWQGTQEELDAVMRTSHMTVRPELLPLRDAIDWIHTVIHTTIRSIKFTGGHTCGGPVEIAAITSDRPFRWICHKRLDAAIITAQEATLP